MTLGITCRLVQRLSVCVHVSKCSIFHFQHAPVNAFCRLTLFAGAGPGAGTKPGAGTRPRAGVERRHKGRAEAQGQCKANSSKVTAQVRGEARGTCKGIDGGAAQSGSSQARGSGHKGGVLGQHPQNVLQQQGLPRASTACKEDTDAFPAANKVTTPRQAKKVSTHR